MSLESATYIADLVNTNPTNTDGKAEGDDHLRLIKATLQASLPGLAGRFRRFQAKSAGYGPVLNDNTSILRCTANLTLTLAAVSTYGNGYELCIVADGGDVTLTPNGTEKINGQGTYVVPNGYMAVLYASAIASAEYFLVSFPLTVVASAVGADITGNITITGGQFGGVRRITATAIVTLPAIAGVATGRTMLFKSATTGDVTLAPNGAETIDGVAASFRVPAFSQVELTKVASGYIITREPAAYVGELRPIAAGVAAPNGWARADFSTLSRTTYAGLFAVVGTVHGVGDGSTTFNVPDSRGRGLLGDGTGTVIETITAANVNTGTDTFTVGSNADKWITGMSVVFTTTGTPPSPLVDSTTYFIIRDSATTVKLATTLANAQNGTAINLTTQGTNNHTLTYTQTARTVGDRGGEEAHAMGSTELLSHLHGGVPSGTLNTTGGSNALGNTVNGSTTATGGNVAMNVMNPYGVARFMVKL